MKKTLLTMVGLLVAILTHAQTPVQQPDPVCAYCGVSLKKGEAHKKDCPYYVEPGQEDSLSVVKDTIPQPSLDIVITCPQCGETFHGKSASLAFERPENHKPNCPFNRVLLTVPQVKPFNAKEQEKIPEKK